MCLPEKRNYFPFFVGALFLRDTLFIFVSNEIRIMRC